MSSWASSHRPLNFLQGSALGLDDGGRHKERSSYADCSETEVDAWDAEIFDCVEEQLSDGEVTDPVYRHGHRHSRTYSQRTFSSLQDLDGGKFVGMAP